MQCALCVGRLVPIAEIDMRRLAAAVVTRAVDDVLGNFGTSGSMNSKAHKDAIRNEALEWFRSDRVFAYSYVSCCRILNVPLGRFRRVVEKYVASCTMNDGADLTTIAPWSEFSFEIYLPDGESRPTMT
jgi:hypothetical protein